MGEKLGKKHKTGSKRLGVFFDPGTTITGVMLLEKTDTRQEKQYFYFSNIWNDLREMLLDPVVFFQTRVGSAEASLVGPVTAIINPVSSDIPGNLEKVRFLAEAARKEDKTLKDEKIAVDKLDKELLGSNDGWFLAQYANLTGLLEIFYLSPSRGTFPNKYDKSFTPFVVCNMGNRPFSTGALCQMHFDLETKSDGSDLKQKRADFIVDLMQDKGKYLCDWVDKNLDMKHTKLKAVLTGTPTPSKPKKGKFQKGRFRTKYLGSAAPDGPTITVEKLSTNFPTKTLSGQTIEYFVCSQNAGTFIGDFDSGTVNVEMGDTVLKIYQDPVGP